MLEKVSLRVILKIAENHKRIICFCNETPDLYMDSLSMHFSKMQPLEINPLLLLIKQFEATWTR